MQMWVKTVWITYNSSTGCIRRHWTRSTWGTAAKILFMRISHSSNYLSCCNTLPNV